MNNFKSFERKIYEVNDYTFPDIALEIFRLQAVHNPVYASYIQHLKVQPTHVKKLEDIPFLPISFFKNHVVKTGSWKSDTVFTSSGTTGVNQSRHHIHDLSFYLEHSRHCFEHHFGSLKEYHFLALLPSYLEREGSSLISMITHFIEYSESKQSGFYLRDYEGLLENTQRLNDSGRKTIIWGVSFALLELAEQYPVDLSQCLIFETGGMKGRRKEITRLELHDFLKKSFNSRDIYSEYGMTELMSQSYTLGGHLFHNPPSMRIIGRDLSDPLQKGVEEEVAGMNIIDLANFGSISFLETEDLGKVYRNGTYEILGRIDNSDIRGCNLMI